MGREGSSSDFADAAGDCENVLIMERVFSIDLWISRGVIARPVSGSPSRDIANGNSL